MAALHDVVARVLWRRGESREAVQGDVDSNENSVRERHAGQRVLLVEDNVINRLVARELLTSVALVVEEAENGAIALDLATSRRYDIVLMDMQMPVMDGLEATRAIRLRRGGAMPIVAMTANAFVEDHAAWLAAGMDDHLAKPVDPALLYAMSRRWLVEARPAADIAG